MDFLPDGIETTQCADNQNADNQKADNQRTDIPVKKLTPEIPKYLKHRGRIDIDKAIELRLKGVTLADIGARFGVTKQSAQEALAPYVSAEDIDMETWKKNRADLIAHKGATVLSRLTADSLKGASPKDLALTFGILYDKERLERGLSTQNTAVVLASAVLEADKKTAAEEVVIDID